VRNSICCRSTDGRGFFRVKEILVRGTRKIGSRNPRCRIFLALGIWERTGKCALGCEGRSNRKEEHRLVSILDSTFNIDPGVVCLHGRKGLCEGSLTLIPHVHYTLF